MFNIKFTRSSNLLNLNEIDVPCGGGFCGIVLLKKTKLLLVTALFLLCCSRFKT